FRACYIRRWRLGLQLFDCRPLIAAFALGGSLIACGGGNGNGATPPSQEPTPTPQNPCPAATLQSSSESERVAPLQSKTSGLSDPDPRGTIFDVLWRHRATTG